ncbi:SLC13 family permease [Clostridium lundense]|uniref:SLC13 family permease n=1 Tax=Clostridium lundense TaxID=319475 RepID=UPI0004883D0A|nr:SLC13 family permease [Clostridium lundense]
MNVTQQYSFKIISKLRGDIVLTISLMTAIITSFVKVPSIKYIDFKVIILLFNLMVVVKAFEEIKLMDKVAITLIYRYKSLRRVSLALIFITFFTSMLVTNDVALLTFVPLTIIISKKSNANFMKTIIFQTLAANIGSSFTPMGNPQNLFLFTHYHMKALDFFKVTFPLALMGILWLTILNFTIPKDNLKFKLNFLQVKDNKRLIIYAILFFIIILSVLNVIDYKLAFIITVLCVLTFDIQLMKRVDYLLLITFICFFISIGNLSNMKVVHSYIQVFLSGKAYTYISSILLSQIISNVPCAILVAEFTQNWKQVLLGVNIGGMGTLIASLASVISYKLYINDVSEEEKKNYLLKFSFYNFISLFIFAIINYMIN